MKLRILQHTIFKQQPRQSHELAYNEKISAYSNTEFEIDKYDWSENGHIKVYFIKPVPQNRKSWYVFYEHIQILEDIEKQSLIPGNLINSIASKKNIVSPVKSTWKWPMRGTSMGVITEFGYARGRLHAGVDIGGYTPDECYAASDGIVDYVKPFNGGAEGRAIYIKRADGWQHVYFHLKSILVKPGQTITQGQLIGIRGGSGFGYEGLEIDGGGYSIHLHFEIHKPTGEPINPRSVLPDDGSVPIVG